ncbi:hypothetical protein [Nocardiopsis composta]|uniref:Uncharacterized protein n=1 Tax=Nocardiopsis composta TaxID=157465 RepID=A0A7W8VH96_9ACTN|nr:hypothetical protein [Nocardiopsis composta]MBB5435955.1 hypothetical protein [Nocardiopsis composta]
MARHSAERDGDGPRGRGGGWLPLGVALGAIALLTAGWPAVDAAVADAVPVPPGRPVQVGAGHVPPASIELGPGWSLHEGQSRDGENYLFARGPVELRLSTVGPATPATPDRLWDGLRRTVRVDDPTARLGEPQPITSAHGAEGRTGPMRGDTASGSAAVFRSPGGEVAVQLVLAAGPGTPADRLAEAEQVFDTVAFGENGEGAS